tara:strand:- start:826 stop:1614 length:789 start_codon:yes stop_codon:yes gene_type:complete
MKITRKQIREAIKEFRTINEDHIDTELDHLKKNVHDDIEHIKDLKDDIKDDHEEELRAEKEKRDHEKHEALRRRILKMIRETHHEQGYDAREDEHLAALYGPATDHEQDYKDRRDDAGFEEREDEQEQGSHIEVHHHHHHEALKRRLRRIVREACDLGTAAEEDELAPMEFDLAAELAPPVDAADVPSPEDYAAVQDMLTQNAWVVNLAIEQVMEMSGASCERSTVMAIIDFLKAMTEPGDAEPAHEPADLAPVAVPLPGLV